MAKTKSKWAKLVPLMIVVLLAVVLSVTLTACNEGTPGKDGIGIASAVVNDSGELILTYTDGRTENLGKVVGNDGAPGESGDPGETGDTGRGIKDVQIVDGKLVITYTDGTSESVDMPVVEDECEHSAIERITLKEHSFNKEANEVIDGIYLEVCGDCGRSFVKREAAHTFKSTTVEPTCTEEGYTGNVCLVCGYAEEKTAIQPAEGHKWGEPIPVNDKDKNFCEDGGTAVHVCEVCAATEIVEYTEGLGHKFDVATFSWSQQPAADKGGVLSGKCTVCGEYQEVDTPALNSSDYRVEDAEGHEFQSCLIGGQFTYYYLYKADETSEAVELTNLPVPVTVAPSEHKLGIPAGDGTYTDVKALSELAEQDGPRKGMFDIDKLIAMGYKLFNNEPVATCNIKHTDNDVLNGYLEAAGLQNAEGVGLATVWCCECASDADSMFTIVVFRDHTPDENGWTTVTEPTCTTPGSEKAACVVCGEETVTREIPALGHDVIKKLEQNGENYKVVMSCSRCDWTESKNVDAKDVQVEVIVEPTCVQEGKAMVTYDGMTEEIVLPKNDEAHDILAPTKDGKYLLGTPGVFVDDAYKGKITCSADGIGYVVCAHKDASGVEHTVQVTIYVEHTYNTAQIENATCTTSGTKTFTCTVCHESYTEYIEPLGHDYELEMVTLPTIDGAGSANLVCKTCGHRHDGVTLPALSDDAYEYNVTTDATCSSQGRAEYTISLTVEDEFTIKSETNPDGETTNKSVSAAYTFSIVTDKTEHMTAEELPEGTPTYTWTDKNGVTYTGYICQDCGNMIVVKTVMSE